MALTLAGCPLREVNVGEYRPDGPVLAFPGAQGGGALSKGGRQGRVFEVTTLEDSGDGSLRACVESGGPRTCVFRVSGVIRLRSPLVVRSGELTVAGQTAPGDGIALYTGDVSNIYAFAVDAPHVIIRYLRIWGNSHPDDASAVSSANLNVGIDVEQASTDLMVDHVTIVWQTSFGIAVSGSRSATFSWNLIGENVRYSTSFGQATPIAVSDTENRYDPGAGGTAGAHFPMSDLDFHHNLITSGSHMMPNLCVATGRFVNNAIYNWGRGSFVDAAGSTGTLAKVDFIANHYKPGPFEESTPYTEIMANRSDNGGQVPFVSLYLHGNRSDWPNGARGAVGASDDDAKQWSLLTSASSAFQGPSEQTPLRGWGTSSGYARAPYERLPPPASGADIIPESADTLQASLTAPGGVGCSRRLDCTGGWVNISDSGRDRILSDYVYGTGPVIPPSGVGVANGGTLPVLVAGTACADRDRDGMPDAFEALHALNPEDPADGASLAADGYSWLEHYLNGR